MRYFDPRENRLIYIRQTPTPDFWDAHWNTDNLRHDITKRHFDALVVPTTKKYLPAGSRILEGGCGTGVHVYNLVRHGYRACGIDNAPHTVAAINRALPELDVRLGDVFSLPFGDAAFDGYWSIGVIEHFWRGFDGIAQEMRRVLRAGGFLFLTFPYMSPLRRRRAQRGAYPLYEHTQEPDNFYQFALNHRGVAQTFAQHGFHLIQTKPFDAPNGLRGESAIARALLRPRSGKNLPVKIARRLISRALSPWCAHSVLLVLQKI